MATPGTPPRPPRYLAVVRRGETGVYRVLKEYLEARGVAQVVWDRRVGERRFAGPGAADSERRRSDRRGPASNPSARTLGFFIARPGAEASRVGKPRREGSAG
ncbi:MAG: hypothetical protein HY359_18510 [Candidatus Rokubacteria bacterium]|nr:hypothetical protein [Candidatus Rokubacteria bacterium]